MFCPHCGSKVDDAARFCSGCGANLNNQNNQNVNLPPPQYPPYGGNYGYGGAPNGNYNNAPNGNYYNAPNGNRQKPNSALAIVGFILSFFSGLAGLIISIVAIAGKTDNKGFAIAGVTLSAFRLVFEVIYFFWLIFFLALI